MAKDERPLPPRPPVDVLFWHFLTSRYGLVLAFVLAVVFSARLLACLLLFWWAAHRVASFLIYPAQLFYFAPNARDGRPRSGSSLFCIGDPTISKAGIAFMNRIQLLAEKSNDIRGTRRDLGNHVEIGMRLLKDAGGKAVEIVAYDGMVLDAMIFSSTESVVEPEGIIFVGGNAEHYGMHGRTADNSAELADCRKRGYVLLVNLRGVFTGSRAPTATCTGLMLDVDAAVHFFHATVGLPYERIVIRGRSIGGGLATEVASWRPGVGLINSRSFSSLSKCAGALVHPVCAHLVWLFGWEIDAARAFSKVRGAKMVETVTGDEIILAGTRMIDALPEVTRNITLKPGWDSPHNRPLNLADLALRWPMWQLAQPST